MQSRVGPIRYRPRAVAGVVVGALVLLLLLVLVAELVALLGLGAVVALSLVVVGTPAVLVAMVASSGAGGTTSADSVGGSDENV